MRGRPIYLCSNVMWDGNLAGGLYIEAQDAARHYSNPNRFIRACSH
jgi:hypothetical protein